MVTFAPTSIAGTRIFTNLPRKTNKYVCLYINGKEQLTTYQHCSSHTRLVDVLNKWERIYDFADLFVAAHITYQDTLRTFVRTEPGIWLES